MTIPESLPHVNACLNATSGMLLTVGYVSVRRGQILAHKACMLAACVASTLFLASYLTYHFKVGHVPFPGTGLVRAFYFSVLITHVVLAIFVPPLAGISLYRALLGQFDQHRRIARWTLPIWLYVSVTGVIVYWMVYQ